MRLTEQEFLAIVQDELALPLLREDLDDDLDAVVHWDSIHVLTLVKVVERRTGHRVPVGRLMNARSLREMYEVLAGQVDR